MTDTSKAAIAAVVERLGKGDPAYASNAGAVYSGPTALHREAKALISALEAERDRLRAELAKAASALPAVEKRVREECAQKAHDWLSEWANDLHDTFESYVEAKTTGTHGGRRIQPQMADMFAKQFRERSDAVANCADPLAAAIRNGGEHA